MNRQTALLFLIITAFFSSHLLMAQKLVNDEGLADYNNEFLAGINFNTNGGLIGGFMFRYTASNPKHPKQFNNFGFDIGIVKHPKEIRLSSNISGGTFVAYKTNHLVVFRPSYGKEFLLFRKANEDGVQLDWLIGGGLSFGMLTPYIVEYDYFTYTSFEQFDPSKHSLSRIVGNGGFMSGLGSSKFVPGFHIKSGISFEYSHFNTHVTGIEVGFMLEAFTKKMEMIRNTSDASSVYAIPNKQVFTSIYVNIFYGGRN
jgi:hypothetical protein